MKVVIVGGVAGGASTAARIRRLDDHAEIVILDRGPHIAFSNCSLPYYIGGDIEDDSSLVMMTPQNFKERYRIEVRTENEVTEILRAEKKVRVKRLLTGEMYIEAYDKLVLSPGASAVKPKSIEGCERKNVFTVRNVADAVALKHYVDTTRASNIAVVGAGFVGLEIAENFVKAGKHVTVIEGLNQVMAPFDHDMAQLLHKELIDNGVELHLESTVLAITQTGVRVRKGEEEQELPADVVVLSVGVKPETALAERAGIATSSGHFIQVNHNYQTNDANIYAVGDAVETYDRMTCRFTSHSLAGPAQRQARLAADHICGQNCISHGFIGTSCLRVFSLNAACTGMNEKTAKKTGIPYEVAYVLPPDKVNIMPGASPMAFKLLFETPTGRILGAQAIGCGDAVRRIDTIVTAISMNATLEDLKDLETCYSPVYGTAKDVVNMAALVGLNLLYGRIRQVRVDQIRALCEAGAYIVDVRETDDYEQGHIKGAHNIPLSQFHKRMHEIPRDIPVYLHCRTAQRSYYALCELMGNGYTNAYNMSGSFLGLCLYEYFTDIDQKREPIVTAYHFK